MVIRQITNKIGGVIRSAKEADKIHFATALPAILPVILAPITALGAFGANAIISNRLGQNSNPNSLWTKIQKFCAELYPDALIATMMACFVQALSYASIPRMVYGILGLLALSIRKPLKEAISLAHERDQLEMMIKNIEQGDQLSNQQETLDQLRAALKEVKKKLGDTNALRNMFASVLAWLMGGTFIAQVPFGVKNLRQPENGKIPDIVSKSLDSKAFIQLIKEGNIKGALGLFKKQCAENWNAEGSSCKETVLSLTRPPRGTMLGKNPQAEAALKAEIGNAQWSPFKKTLFRLGKSSAFPAMALINGSLRMSGLIALGATLIGGIKYFNKGSEFEDKTAIQNMDPALLNMQNYGSQIASGTSLLSSLTLASSSLALIGGGAAASVNGISSILFGANFLGKLAGFSPDLLSMFIMVASPLAGAGSGLTLWHLNKTLHLEGKKNIVSANQIRRPVSR